MLSTYNFFMAAVAQVFATLVALGTVLYVFRMQRLKEKNAICAQGIRFCVLHGLEKDPNPKTPFLFNLGLNITEHCPDTQFIESLLDDLSKNRTHYTEAGKRTSLLHYGQYLVNQCYAVVAWLRVRRSIVLSAVLIFLSLLFILVGRIVYIIPLYGVWYFVLGGLALVVTIYAGIALVVIGKAFLALLGNPPEFKENSLLKFKEFAEKSTADKEFLLGCLQEAQKAATVCEKFKDKNPAGKVGCTVKKSARHR